MPWFAVKRVSKDEYREIVQKRARDAKEERDREAAAGVGGGDSAASGGAALEAPKKRRTPKERMDANWED